MTYKINFEKVWVNVGGRKFIAYIVAIIAVLILSHKAINVNSETVTTIIPDAFNTVLILSGVYTGGNVLQKIKQYNGDTKSNS